ncbi:hypothetical protein ACC791_37950, partial [Rhizobium ruizarguesonis]
LLACITGALEPSEGEITKERGLTVGHVAQNVPAALFDTPFYDAVMQASSVDFPRPLAATRPMRSQALTTRLSLENN